MADELDRLGRIFLGDVQHIPLIPHPQLAGFAAGKCNGAHLGVQMIQQGLAVQKGAAHGISAKPDGIAVGGGVAHQKAAAAQSAQDWKEAAFWRTDAGGDLGQSIALFIG